MTKIEIALANAKSQLGRYVQPCGTTGCKYNYKNAGATACKTPSPVADSDDVARSNEDQRHPFWNFYCLRFVRTSYGAQTQYLKAENFYQALSSTGAINVSKNPPMGALVFWHWANYGHIGISSGDGNILHTGVNPKLKIKGIRQSSLTDITEVLNGYNHYKDSTSSSYLGWALPPENWLK